MHSLRCTDEDRTCEWAFRTTTRPKTQLPAKFLAFPQERHQERRKRSRTTSRDRSMTTSTNGMRCLQLQPLPYACEVRVGNSYKLDWSDSCNDDVPVANSCVTSFRNLLFGRLFNWDHATALSPRTIPGRNSTTSRWMGQFVGDE
jgi:hypothetical protein